MAHPIEKNPLEKLDSVKLELASALLESAADKLYLIVKTPAVPLKQLERLLFVFKIDVVDRIKEALAICENLESKL